MAQSGGKRRRRGISNKIGENEIYTGDWVEFEFGRGEFELPTSEKRGGREEALCNLDEEETRRGEMGKDGNIEFCLERSRNTIFNT